MALEGNILKNSVKIKQPFLIPFEAQADTSTDITSITAAQEKMSILRSENSGAYCLYPFTLSSFPID